MKLIKEVTLLTIYIAFSCATYAAPFNPEQVKAAKNILVIEGIFDPWTKEDEQFVRRMTTSSTDLVILVPTDKGTTDFPLPAEKRVELMETVLGSEKKIVTSPLTLDRLNEKIAELNPHVNLMVERADIASGVKASEDIRDFMSKHPEGYFSDMKLTPPDNIDPKIFEQIRERGLYLGRKKSSGGVMKKILANLTMALKETGIFDPVRKTLVKFLAKPELGEFQAGDTLIKVKKYLASGLNGDAYLIEVNGQKAVLKVAKDTVMAKDSMQKANLAHKWMSQKHESIKMPGIIDADPNGSWQLLEFVNGKNLEDIIAENKGTIPPEIDAKLKTFHAEAVKLNNVSDMKLDISADNIFIRSSDGAPVLVDFGPVQPYQPFDSEYNVARERWIQNGVATMNKKEVEGGGAPGGRCISEGLKSLLSKHTHPN